MADNATIVRRSTTELATSAELTVQHVVDLHAALLPREPQHHGLRTAQNWIGGSEWHPLDADFVPPAPQHVGSLMTDLVAYLNGSAHSALVQAAIVHAQFETIHPFSDGNGRVGRALVHTVLTQRGLTDQAVLPISLVLATLRNDCVQGLTAFRHATDVPSNSATDGVSSWVSTFVEAAAAAAGRSSVLKVELDQLAEDWTERLTRHRTAAGLRAAPRADSAVARILPRLPEAPVLTSATMQRLLNVSGPAANDALSELRDAGILATRSIDRGATAYIARDVLALITMSERALASTQFDTRESPPNRVVPALPDR